MDKKQERINQLERATKLTPRKFAELRSLKQGWVLIPQRVYYFIRTGHIELEECPSCIDNVIDVKRANDFFDELERNGKS